MIPLILSGALGRILKAARSLSPAMLGIIALVAALGIQTYRVSSLSGQLERAIAAGVQMVADTKDATLRNVARQTGRMIAEANTRAQISEESEHEATARNVTLAANYDGLWKKYSRLSAASLTASLPDPAKGFDATSCRDGFLCIPAETAFKLMFHADKNTSDLMQLQSWVRAQAAVDPNLDQAPTP